MAMATRGELEMNRLVESFVFLGLLFASCALATAQSEYVGKSGCDPQFKRAPGTCSIRLDSTQRAYLVAHTLAQVNVLFIVTHKDDRDRCGTIRDAVVSAGAAIAFEFACVDENRLSAVVVGTRRQDDRMVSGEAIQAWLIDIKALKFIADRRPVVCKRPSYAGSDEGDDLASIARKRSSKTHEK